EQRSVAAVRDSIYPAYRRLAAALTDLRGEAQRNPADGMTRLPNGAAAYAALLRAATTSSLPPAQIHETGLHEGERISAEADALLRSQSVSGGTVGERLARLAQDPYYGFAANEYGRQAMLARYREILQQVRERLPDVFDLIPPQRLTVERVPA